MTLDVEVGQRMWIMLAPDFHGVRKIPASVVKIGTKYIYVQPHDKTYIDCVAMDKKTLTYSPHGRVMWTGYLTEEVCDADLERGAAYRRLQQEFFRSKEHDKLSDGFVELTRKLLALVEQYNKEKK